MTEFKRVLSDDDLVDIFALGIGDLSAKPFDELVEVLEQAIISKLKAEQEPVAWTSSKIFGHYATHDTKVSSAEWFKENLDVPLYAHPMPCVSPSTLSDTQAENSPTKGMSLGERIAHVGGRENKDGYVEFGSVMAVHALISHVTRDLGESCQGLLDNSNHIADASKMVPIEPTDEMNAAARDWSIDKYGKAIGFDASRGCYQAMLSAAPKCTGG